MSLLGQKAAMPGASRRCRLCRLKLTFGPLRSMTLARIAVIASQSISDFQKFT
jgi:hypothetical protein